MTRPVGGLDPWLPPREAAHGFSAPEIHRAISAAAGAEGRARLEQARGILLLSRTRLFLRLGFSSLADYAERSLGWTAAETRSSLEAVSRLEALDAVLAALDAGRVSWQAAVHLALVARPATQQAWLSFASSEGQAALIAEVRQASSCGRLLPRRSPSPQPVPPSLALVVSALRARGYSPAESLRRARRASRELRHSSGARPAERLLVRALSY